MPNSIMESITNAAETRSERRVPTCDSKYDGAPRGPQTAVLELRVRNHPGTMSHVTGLFARRAFNLDAIACTPVGDGSTSVMRLLVSEEPRLEQVERQLEKLHDVLSVCHRPDLGPTYFSKFADG